jgi:hypothetical protein
LKESLGKWSSVIADFCSVFGMLAACISFHIYISENLFEIVIFIMKKLTVVIPHWWSMTSSAIISGFLILVLVLVVLFFSLFFCYLFVKSHFNHF